MDEVTKGVQLLLGDPKKAIVNISFPMMIGMLFQTVYSLADGIWVAGLGTDALTAIGFVFPLFMIAISISSGLSIGGSSTISRKIGERRKDLADNSATQSILLTFITGLLITLITIPFLRDVFSIMGAKNRVLELAIDYSVILFSGSILIVFSNVANGILRGEGDASRAMKAMALGSIMNMILDPIFIYTLGFGISGSAIATVLSFGLSSLIMIYWLFIKKDTFVNLSFKDFSINFEILKEILRVGIPSTLIQLTMSISLILLNYIIVKTGEIEGVAVFTSAWRILMFGFLPLIGFAVGVTTVTGSAYGERDVKKLKTAYLYAIKLGAGIEIVIAFFIFIFSPYLSLLFTYSESSAMISGSLTNALRFLSLYLPIVPFGMLTSSMFQGIGRGEYSLAMTILRTLVFQIAFAYIFGIILNLGLNGIWIGITAGNVLAGVIIFVWGLFTIESLKGLKGKGLRDKLKS